MAEDPNPQDAPDWKAIAAQFANGLLTEGIPGIVKAWQAANIETHGAVRALDINLGVDMATFIATHWRDTEEALMPLIGALVAPIVSSLFGAGSGGADYTRRMAAGDGAGVARAIVSGFLASIAGDSAGPIEPGVEGSIRLSSAAVQATLESQLNALIPELISDFLPLDFGHITALMELPEGIIRTLGVSRLVRRALSPLIDATCATPAKWHYSKLYRQTLLGAGEVARQLARGHWTRDQALEELARAGYSDDRIEALLNAAAKFHSVTDVDLLIRTNQWSEADGLQHLKDQGYDEDVARVELLIEKIKRIAAFELSMANAAIDAYVAGRIDEGALGGFVNGATFDAQQKAQLLELAAARRICARRPLSPAEARAAVLDGILSVPDYREALLRDGRTDDAATVLELQLRKDLDDKKSIADHRAEMEKEKADEKAARDAAALAKKAEADARLALSRRGSMAALEAAFIRGQIPIDRVTEVYVATYDGDTVAVLSALLESRRADYVAQQEAAAAATVRAATRGIDVGALEQAVLSGVLTLDQFGARLRDLRFDDTDAGLLTATLDAKLQQRRDADAAHATALAAAAVKHVDLATIELLVRRGHRQMADYERTLQDLGYDDGARAALVERLQIQIDDDAAAAQVRADAAAKLQNKGLSLDQFRRAVLLGVRPITDYGPFLLQNGFDAPSIATLVGELQVDVDEAVAVRARRAEADRRSQANRAPLADVRRAARLGLIPIDAYVDRLRAAGYPEDDIAVEVDLLAQEIADIQTTRDARAAADAAAKNKDIDLPHLERAVRAGLETVDRYVAAARTAGYTAEAAATLGTLLQSEIDAAAAAVDRRAALAAAAAVKHASIAQLEAAVLAGIATRDDYVRGLTDLGFAADDVALLGRLVDDRLARQAAARAKQAALDAANAVKALSRADFAKGVVAGLRTPEAYAAFLTSDGYAPDDVDLLVDLAKMDRATTVAAETRRAELDALNPAKALARADFAKGVLAGLRSPQDYADWLSSQGYADDDVQLLVDLVVIDLQKAADKAAGGAP